MTRPVEFKPLQINPDLDLAKLTEECLAEFNKIIQQQAIDSDLQSQLTTIYLPLAAWIASKHSSAPLVFGLNGAQGSGKSTLSQILQMLLTKHFTKSVCVLSIDDFYLSRQSRAELAEQVHPLFKTRGVPGTHDVDLLEKKLSALVQGQLPIKLPIFDKASDDRLPETQWRIIDKPVDIVLFEGWCVGAQAQSENELKFSVNELERQADAHCVWRNYVNAQLQGPYQALFKKIDYLLMLAVPDMVSVLEWRNLQEVKLAQQCAAENKSSSKLMSAEQVGHFVMHYERLTRSMLNEMPNRADIVMKLNTQHQIETIHVAT